MIIQNSRIEIKYSNITGVVPTIPASEDHTDGTWLSTDLYKGEFFANIADDTLWIRTDSGIIPVVGTGLSVIADYVPASTGGTFNGDVEVAANFTCIDLTANDITANSANFTTTVTAASFSGDGSGLTGIIATWNGGTVLNPTTFQSDVTFEADVITDNISSISGDIAITADLTHTGNIVSSGTHTASAFIGDGSGLTGIPGSTDTFTESAYLDGNILRFDTNDTVDAYNVDLSPITNVGIDTIAWNPADNSLIVTLLDASVITIPINTFTDLTVNGTLTVDTIVGLNDIYTTGATLVGNVLHFDRTDLSDAFSIDLSPLAPTGLSLDEVLVNGNTTNGNNIYFSVGDKIENAAGGNTIGFGITGDRIENISTLGGNTTTISQQSDNITISSNKQDSGEPDTTKFEVIYTPTNNVVRNSFNKPNPGFNDYNFVSEVSTNMYVNPGIAGSTQYAKLLVENTSDPMSTDVAFIMSHNEGSYPSNTLYTQIGNDNTEIFQDPHNITVSSTYADFNGVVYIADYSANYVNRSLVDKEYVDNAIAGSTPTVTSLTETALEPIIGDIFTATIQVDVDTSSGGTGIFLVDNVNPTGINGSDIMICDGVVHKDLELNDNDFVHRIKHFPAQTYDYKFYQGVALSNSEFTGTKNHYILRTFDNDYTSEFKHSISENYFTLNNYLSGNHSAQAQSEYVYRITQWPNELNPARTDLIQTDAFEYSNLGTLVGTGIFSNDSDTLESAGVKVEPNKVQLVTVDETLTLNTKVEVQNNKITHNINDTIYTVERSYSETLLTTPGVTALPSFGGETMDAGDVCKVELELFGSYTDSTQSMYQKLSFVLCKNAANNFVQVGGTNEELITDFNTNTKMSFGLSGGAILYNFNLDAADVSTNIKISYRHKITYGKI